MWKGKKSNGIMNKDGEINFGKLEQQIDTAVSSDNLYWVQNEAKIRAVTNKVASYEEFVDIVKASHLKPLEKGDRISDIKVFNQPWNINAGSSSRSADEPSNADISSTKIMDISHFNRRWKYQCKTSQDKYYFLLSIKCEDIGRIFKAEIGLGLLGDMILVIQENYKLEDAQDIANLLLCLSQCGRFDLSLQFLSHKEKNGISEVISKLHDDWNVEKSNELSIVYGTGSS